MLSSFVAVVASGKSSEVYFAAQLSDPDLPVDYLYFSFAWTVAKLPAKPQRSTGQFKQCYTEHCSPPSILYTSANRISMERKIKLLILTSRHVMVWAQDTRKVIIL